MRKASTKVPKGKKAVIQTSLKGRKIVPVLDIPVDSTRKEKVLSEILQFLDSEAKGKLFITTPNPEILAAAAKDAYYASILQGASLALPDGIGVVMAQKFLSAPVSDSPILRLVDMLRVGFDVGLSVFYNRKSLFAASEVVPGRVVFEQLTGEAAKHNWRVMLVGGQSGVAQKAAEHFVQRASQQGNKLTICAETGPWLDKTGEPTSQHEARVEQATIGKINKFKPHLLFVAFGLPKQEIWLSKHMNRLNVRVAMVVGGSFDYAAGNVPIPPEGVSRAGFEWLWRLLTQPWRAKRIATALLVFPWLVFLSKLHQKTN